ncbi:hypothetical protein C2G38_2029451 [Gigaspora rosea]|uniref:Uncharacterized protein n=1 Tax=Gigaspora rosea TaxID=44941 RepID=A0A397VXN1_9GLOM|nr:hypothetical protein C2G38_2029451 [Gigaspora rosea]
MRKKSTNWKTVTQHVISKAQANNALPNYINIGDTICLNCYNGIMQGLARFQNVQTSIEQPKTDTLADLGITIISCMIIQTKNTVSEKYEENVNSELSKHADKAMVLNIDDYHSIYMEHMLNTMTTSTNTHLATILINLITNQPAILKRNLHNPVLIDTELIKTNIEDKFMMFYGLSHNYHWGFCTVSGNTRLDELTVHSYDIRLKKK